MRVKKGIKLGPHQSKPIRRQAQELGIEPEELVMMAVEANGGNQFKAALQLGVYPSALRHWKCLYDQKKMTPLINDILGDGNPRWMIRSVQYDWDGKVNVNLVLGRETRKTVSYSKRVGVLVVSGRTHEEILANIRDFVRFHDPADWLDGDKTQPIREDVIYD